MNIQELEAWFKAVELPPAPLYSNPSTKINNIGYFLESHFSPLRDNPINNINQPLLDRILAFKFIESNL